MKEHEWTKSVQLPTINHIITHYPHRCGGGFNSRYLSFPQPRKYHLAHNHLQNWDTNFSLVTVNKDSHSQSLHMEGDEFAPLPQKREVFNYACLNSYENDVVRFERCLLFIFCFAATQPVFCPHGWLMSFDSWVSASQPAPSIEWTDWQKTAKWAIYPPEYRILCNR